MSFNEHIRCHLMSTLDVISSANNHGTAQLISSQRIHEDGVNFIC
jgi:hypothetical protein